MQNVNKSSDNCNYYGVGRKNWINVFFTREIFIGKKAQKPLKKILRKSQTSNAWAAVFENGDFC